MMEYVALALVMALGVFVGMMLVYVVVLGLLKTKWFVKKMVNLYFGMVNMMIEDEAFKKELNAIVEKTMEDDNE